MKLLERMRLQTLIKNIPISTSKDNPLLKKQLDQVQKDLNLILNKWKFGDLPIKSAQEFLNSFEPWINKKIVEQGELKTFLEEQGASNLNNLKETWKNTEADYLRRIEELKSKGTTELSEEDKEKLAEYEDLITERDEAIRDKKTLEQQNLSLNNGLKLKQQEASNKDKALEKLKKEKGELDKNLNKKITEKNGLITTLNQEIKQHKEKYSKQGKLLDTEQLECKKLEEKVEKLEKDYNQREEDLKVWREEQVKKIETVNKENRNLKEEIKKMKEKGWK